MNRQILNITANEQILSVSNPIHISTNKVSYIEARFDLGTNWSGYDSVRAVWFNDFQCISTVLDANGKCLVPFEVMKRKGNIKVNLVGSISENDVLTDRLTSYPIVAVVVDCVAQITGSETSPITPSQFEQFVDIVNEAVSEVTGMSAEASTLPAGSRATASYSNGVLSLGIPRGDKGDTGATGPQGETGATGADGFSPVVTVTDITGGHEISIEDAVQTQTFDVMDGVTPVIPWDSILPTDTASGSIASFSDGTDLVPAKSVVIRIEPIQSGSGTPSPTNIRPISGHTEVDTHRTGVNVWDEEWEIISNVLNSKNYIPVLPNTQYYITPHQGGDYRCFDSEFNEVKSWTWLSPSYSSFTTPSNCYYIKFRMTSGYGTTYNHDISINYPSTDHEYHAYNGTTYTTTLGRTVYGGKPDVVSGELVVDRATLTFDGTESGAWGIYGRGEPHQCFSIGISGKKIGWQTSICNQFPNVNKAFSNSEYGIYCDHPSSDTVYFRQPNAGIVTVADWRQWLSQNPVQLVYELATPITYNLTPTDIALLQGQNNVWADCGEVSVTYKADIQGYINKKINALI